MVKISGRELEALGRGFRQAFSAKVTTDFDDMLSAIDRAHLAAVARLDGCRRRGRWRRPTG